MDKVETSPRVRHYSERNSLDLKWRIVIGVVIGIALAALLGGLIYYLVTRDPKFTASYGDSWVDSTLTSSSYLQDKILICGHTEVVLRYNGTSYLQRDKACVQTSDQRYDSDYETESGYVIPYFEKSFICTVHGSNITSYTAYASQSCTYFGDFELHFTVTNASALNSKQQSGNGFKLKEISIEFDQKLDWSKLQKKMVKGFSWINGQMIARSIKEAMISKYTHEDYKDELNEKQALEVDYDTEACLNYWPCPNYS